VEGLIKVKDSYNCDRLSLAGGAAALADQVHLAQRRGQILATRQRLFDAARALGYQVPESQANFLWCTGGPAAAETYEALRARGILVRLMRYPGQEPGLRITVGTDDEIDRLIEAWRAVVSG
jgi:histidinol-phosphate aminotransferase